MAAQRMIVGTALEEAAHANPFVVGARMALDQGALVEACSVAEVVGLGHRSYMEAVVVQDVGQSQDYHLAHLVLAVEELLRLASAQVV